MPFEFDDQQNEAWNYNDVNSIIKRSSFKHSFKSCNSADISRKSNKSNIPTKGTHNAIGTSADLLRLHPMGLIINQTTGSQTAALSDYKKQSCDEQ
jgi:hypothetical protein